MRLFAPVIALAALCCTPTAAPAQSRMITIGSGAGTVTQAAVSQPVFAANPDRLYLLIQNPNNATETLYVDYGVAASITGNSVELAPGGSVEFIALMTPTQSINVTAATAGHRFIAKQSSNN